MDTLREKLNRDLVRIRKKIDRMKSGTNKRQAIDQYVRLLMDLD